MHRLIIRMLMTGITIGSILVSMSPLGTASAMPSQAASSVLHIVALGDSDTTGSGDPTGLGWVGRYARLLHQKRGLTVRVENIAQNGKTSDTLLREVRTDSAWRSYIKCAQIILIGIGGNDLAPGDAKWEAGTCKGKACYTKDLQMFAQNFERTVQQIRRLRTPHQAVLRAITFVNGFPGGEDLIPSFFKHEQDVGQTFAYQSEFMRDAICGSMKRHGGQCVDVFGAFNGPSGTEDAYGKGLMSKVDCCYPTAKGQQLMAHLLFKTGLAPLR